MMVARRQVFISYQRADELFARQVRDHLVSNGVKTWMDQYDIPVGAYWPDEIDKGLSDSDIVVGILSPDAVDSRNVKNEWDWAIANDKPLLLLQVRPSVIPHRYISINYIDATGADPEPALAALSQTLGAVGAAPGGSPAVSGHAHPTRHGSRRAAVRRLKPLLIGREREQERLSEQLGSVLSGRGALVLIGGEAGIGKTTLTTWLLAEAEERGAVVLTGGCYDLSTTRPYGPWAEIFRAWPDDDALPPLPAELHDESGLSTLQSQAALFAAVNDALADASTSRPLVLLLEDLHWADQASLDLLRTVARFVERNRLLLAVTYRDDEITRRHPLAAFLPNLAREANAHRITLQRLDETATRQLITTRYPVPEDEAERLAAYVQQITEGNPFFAGEVLTALEEAGALTRTTDGWRLERLEQVQVPTLVRQVVDSRLAHLGEDARRQIEIAAVIGHETPIDLWVAVSGADELVLAEVLEQASEARIIEELRGGAGFRFTHALIRETLYEGLVLLRRRAWHRKTADVLMTEARPDPDAVAHHLQQAGDPRQGEWLVRAAERAMHSYAWTTAVERFETAATAEADPGTRGWLLYRAAHLVRFSDPRRSVRLYAEAIESAREAGDEVLGAYAMADSGRSRTFSGDFAGGISELSKGADLIDELPPDYLRQRPEIVEWIQVESAKLDRSDDVPAGNRPLLNPKRGIQIMVLASRGYVNQAIEIGERCIGQIASIDALSAAERLAMTNIQSGLGMAYWLSGRPSNAERFLEHAAAGYERRGSHLNYGIAVGFQLTQAVMYRTDDLDERRRLTAAVDSAWERLGATGGRTTGQGTMTRFWEGDWGSVRETADRLVSQLDAFKTGWDIAAADNLALHQGDAERIEQLFRTILPDGPATAPGGVVIYNALDVLCVTADWAITTGELGRARECVEAHHRWLEWSGARFYHAADELLQARYHRAACDHETAVAHAEAALRITAEPRQPLLAMMAHRQLGELATDAADYDTAARHLTQSLDLVTSFAMPFEHARTLVALAELHLATGDTASARTALAAARDTCERLEARPTLEHIAELESAIAAANADVVATAILNPQADG